MQCLCSSSCFLIGCFNRFWNVALLYSCREHAFSVSNVKWKCLCVMPFFVQWAWWGKRILIKTAMLTKTYSCGQHISRCCRNIDWVNFMWAFSSQKECCWKYISSGPFHRWTGYTKPRNILQSKELRCNRKRLQIEKVLGNWESNFKEKNENQAMLSYIL